MNRVAGRCTAVIAATLVGACVFGPGHPRTWAVGVVSANGASPIAGATVSLFSTKAVTPSSGCFKLQLSSALPLTLAASAPGYKPVEVPAKFGFYRVEVTLEPESSNRASSITWRPSSEGEVLHATCA